ncbi:hypothetical protein CEXT_228941 [Caerostris extrusa]|uniref:Uncharacterized protein n=1 Tax=Caerostris extrusa TaxID=172846 RepID=A0AAV4NPQ1_CAEEX|nr:hypothetical protein CEXT_228941 [Caerostris extrusa]
MRCMPLCSEALKENTHTLVVGEPCPKYNKLGCLRISPNYETYYFEHVSYLHSDVRPLPTSAPWRPSAAFTPLLSERSEVPLPSQSYINHLVFPFWDSWMVNAAMSGNSSPYPSNRQTETTQYFSTLFHPTG